MTTRDATRPGTPCWTDLWTSDVEASRRFYRDLFAWEPLAPDPEFGGYFLFSRRGGWTAGCMGAMGDATADDTWKPYLATSDMTTTLKAAEAAGAQIRVPGMPVGDLGIQGVVEDPTGATLGLWEAGTWPGFSVVEEPGAPSWFELHTRDYEGALSFYREVFGFEVDMVSEAEGFHYSTLRLPGDPEPVAGVCGDGAGLAAGEPARWAVYWEVDDVDAAVSAVSAAGGTVAAGAETTPYGRIATVADPSGASFMLRTHPA